MTQRSKYLHSLLLLLSLFSNKVVRALGPTFHGANSNTNMKIISPNAASVSRAYELYCLQNKSPLPSLSEEECSSAFHHLMNMVQSEYTALDIVLTDVSVLHLSADELTSTWQAWTIRLPEGEKEAKWLITRSPSLLSLSKERVLSLSQEEMAMIQISSRLLSFLRYCLRTLSRKKRIRDATLFNNSNKTNQQ